MGGQAFRLLLAALECHGQWGSVVNARLFRFTACLLALPSTVLAQPAFDLSRLQGAWVPQGSRCEQVFFRQGTSINFRRAGSEKREGLLIKGKRIEDSRNRCNISNGKQGTDRQGQILLLTCFSGLLVAKLSFSVRFPDENTAVRTLIDFPDEEARFSRCKL
jgi:hypothetical protein